MRDKALNHSALSKEGFLFNEYCKTPFRGHNLYFNSLMAILRNLCAPPGRHEPDISNSATLLEYGADQCTCSPIIPSVAPAVKSFTGSATVHICLPLSQRVRCGTAPSIRMRNVFQSFGFHTDAFAAAVAVLLTAIRSPNKSPVPPGSANSI